MNLYKIKDLIEIMNKQELVSKMHKGSVATVIGGLVVGIVMLYIGLYMIDAVATAASIANTSDFYTTYTSLITTTGTIFSVLGLVIIIVSLATAIGALKDMS